MSGGPPLPPERVPTLTEVVMWPSGSAALAEKAASAGASGSAAPAAAAVATAYGSTPPSEPAASEPPLTAKLADSRPVPTVSLSEAELSERIFAEVQRQIDVMLDYRLREVLTPLLSRLADNLVRETRAELASTLREVVASAVAQELSRHRVR